jgi:hypothetical protein
MSRADDLYADHDPLAAGWALKERDAALAVIERVKALIDPAAEMAIVPWGNTRCFDEKNIRAALDVPAVPQEPTP